MPPRINPLGSTRACVASLFKLWSVPIPAINFALACADERTPLTPDQEIIVTQFLREAVDDFKEEECLVANT